MLYRTSSCHAGLGLQSHMNLAVLTDHSCSIPKSRSCPDLHGLHLLTDHSCTIPKSRSCPDLNGLCLSKKILRADTSAWQPASNARIERQTQSSAPTYTSLAAPQAMHGRNRQGLVAKKTTKRGQVSPTAPSLIYKGELRCEDSFGSPGSECIQLHGARRLQGRRSDDLLIAHEVDQILEEERLSDSEPFISRNGEPRAVSGSTLEPDELDGSNPLATKGVQRKGVTMMQKIWKSKKEKRRTGSLLLLNVLAALYGSSNVASGIVTDSAPLLPASLNSLVRFTSASIFFGPALIGALRNRDMGLLRAGAELGGLAFAATVVDSCSPARAASNSAALLFAFTVIFVPIMEFCAGRQSTSALARFATLAAIIGMGLLEEEGFGWKGICFPQIGDFWGLAVSIISAIHIFRSEAHGVRFDPLRLNAVQCGTLTILSLGWETLNTFDASALQPCDILAQIPSLPWAPLIYNGLVCFGLCSWLEIYGLRSIEASTATLVYTTIPVWGAFLSFFTHHETPADCSVIGALVIIVTSLYAQMTAKSVDHMDFRRKSFSSGSNTASQDQGTSKNNDSQIDLTIEENKSSESTESNAEAPDYFPAALLTSQLKFPYYAAQVQKLLADVKIKVGAIKSILLTTASSSMLTTGSSGPSNGNASNGTAPPAGTTHGASNLSASGSAAPVHVGTLIDVSTTQHIAHGPVIVGSLSSSGPPGPDIISAAASTHAASSAADSTAHINMSLHTLTALTTGLESALVAAGSDMVLGFEEAEDVATRLELLIKTAVENAAHTIAGCMSGDGAWLTANTFTNIADHNQKHQPLCEKIASSLPSHIADGMLESVFHLVQPLMNILQI